MSKSIDDVILTGVYRIYDGDTLVSEQKNALTSLGRSMAIRSLLGYEQGIANTISIGISASPNVLNSASTLIQNTTMGFEIGRSPIEVASTEISGDQTVLVFHGILEDANDYSIYEVGLINSKNINESMSVDGSVIFNFDQVEIFTKYGTSSYVSLVDTSSARIGTQMLVMNQGNGTTNYIERRYDIESLGILSEYSSDDTFRLAMYNTQNTGASINFRFYNDSTNYYTLTMVSSPTSGYQVIQSTKGSAVQIGTPNWNNISSISIWNSSAHDIYLDALKIDSGDYIIETNYGLVSRAVLPTPVVKNSTVPLTVQYSLLANFSGGV